MVHKPIPFPIFESQTRFDAICACKHDERMGCSAGLTQCLGVIISTDGTNTMSRAFAVAATKLSMAINLEFAESKSSLVTFRNILEQNGSCKIEGAFKTICLDEPKFWKLAQGFSSTVTLLVYKGYKKNVFWPTLYIQILYKRLLCVS